ncbi:MAG: hypothetical protein ACOX8A_01905 [Thermacetogeniaceae bacterium]
MKTCENVAVDPKIKEAVLKAAKDGKITCPAARSIASSLGVEPKVIGDACNALKIKIHGCALGCF